MKKSVVLFLAMSILCDAGPVVRKIPKYYLRSKRPKTESSYAKIGGKWVLHGRKRTFYDRPKTPKGAYPLAISVIYEKGVVHGVYVKYFPSGVIEKRGQYERGRKSGKWRTFYKSGASHMDYVYGANGLTGLKTTLSPKGTKLSEVHYVDGRKDGNFRTWYATGKLKIVAQYDDGTLDGKLNTWHETGKRKSVCTYVDGVKHGKEMLWTDKGLPKSRRTYVEGKEQGVVTLWDEDGKLASEKTYKNGTLDGSFKEYHPTGETSRDATYKNGLLHGLETFRLDNGSKRSEANYHFGKKHGMIKVYYPNGKLRSEVVIDRGKRQGLARYWNATEKLIGQGTFTNDAPIVGTFIVDASPDFTDYFVAIYEAGRQKDFLFYRGGRLATGQEIEKFPYSETVSRTCAYKNGKLNGADERFFRDGEMAYKVFWLDNVPDGMIQRWHPNGKKMWEVQFDRGKKDGYEKAWDVRGRELCSGEHRNGKPWNGSVLIYDVKEDRDVIRLFKDGRPVKDLPGNLQIKINRLPDITVIKHQGVDPRTRGMESAP